jgi:hypothetical protein
MLRWFSDFDHIALYVTIKIFLITLLLVVMWLLINRRFELYEYQYLFTPIT